MIKTFDEFINESEGRENGVVLVLGPENDGKKKLFMLKLKLPIKTMSRKKVSGDAGESARMALLYPELYIVKHEGDELTARRMAHTPESLKRVVGLSKFSVTLNNNKTPLHWESIGRHDWKRFLNDFKDEIKSIPKITLQ